MPIVSIVFDVLASRLGQICLSFVAGFLYAWLSTNHAWEIKVASERSAAQAVLKAEIERERQAAAIIAKDATIRAEQDANEMSELQRIISDFDKKERVIVKTEKGKCAPCTIDRDFADVVQRVKSRRR